MTSEPGSAVRTLVVEDDPHLAAGLVENLRAEGYAVDTAADGRLALSWLRAHSCELVVLDVMLPHIDGFTVCRTLREEGNNTPVLFLTARGDPLDRVLGLEALLHVVIDDPVGLRALELTDGGDATIADPDVGHEARGAANPVERGAEIEQGHVEAMRSVSALDGVKRHALVLGKLGDDG